MNSITFMPPISAQLSTMNTFAKAPHNPSAWQAVQSSVIAPLGIDQGAVGGLSSFAAGESEILGFRDRVIKQVRPHLNERLLEYSQTYRKGNVLLERPADFIGIVREARTHNVVSNTPAEAMLLSASLMHPELGREIITSQEGSLKVFEVFNAIAGIFTLYLGYNVYCLAADGGPESCKLKAGFSFLAALLFFFLGFFTSPPTKYSGGGGGGGGGTR